jgi:hypothetical protein
LRSLETLRDLRLAARRPDLATRCHDLQRLRRLLKGSGRQEFQFSL